MKYTIQENVWQDKITGQRYTKDYSCRPVVSFNVQGEILKGYSYSPYGVAPENEKMELEDKQYGYEAYCFGQKIFLTAEQEKIRFEYLGKIERQEDIAKSVQEYSEEKCNFDNLEWLAQMTLRDLTHKSSGGLSQCVQAKLLEFLLKNAPESKEMEEFKKIYFSQSEVLDK